MRRQNSPTAIIEINLLSATWRRVVLLSRTQSITFSWTVRLATFRFLRENAGWTPELRQKNNDLREEYGRAEEPLHRHLLCLYGEDGILIRMAAAKWGITMSRLVRLALDCYPGDEESDLVMCGIKMVKQIKYESPVMDFHNKQWLIQVFQKEDYYPHRPIHRKPAPFLRRS